MTTTRQKEDVVAAAQLEVNKVYDWSQKCKLNLNVDKSKVFPFSTWTKNSKCRPSLSIGEKQVRINDTPRPLDVILDQSLSFHADIKPIKQLLSSRFCKIIYLQKLDYFHISIFNIFIIFLYSYYTSADITEHI